MNQKLNFTIVTSCVLIYSLVLSSCAESTAIAPSPVATFSQTPQPTETNIPSSTTTAPATPTVNNNTIIITSDDLFSSLGLEPLSTPDSEDFCEHLPPAQIIANPKRLSLLSGRFVLCSWENWPWVTDTAMDLDAGDFVPKDDEKADIVMQNGPGDIDEVLPSFVVYGLNGAQVDGVTTDAISYEYCQQDLLSSFKKNIQTVLLVNDGSIACVKTTEGDIALIRVEEIYPPNILSVEFSFAILRNE